MAKTRAQRKAEKRRREAQLERERQAGAPPRGDEAAQESRAQHDTQTPVSGDVAEAEAVIQTGARPEDYGEHTVEHGAPGSAQARAAVPGVTPEPVVPEPMAEPEAPVQPPAPAPSRADVGAPTGPRESRRERKRREKDERKRARERELQKSKAAEKQEKRRGGVVGFLASCWAELKKVQWPDRDTLVQASAVTIIFVAVMAAYLGALDGIFNWLIKQLL